MVLNQAQKEGVAKFFDNLATASMVAALVGGVVDRKIDWQTIAVLCTVCFVNLSLSLVIRSEKGDENCH